jgi:lysozyme
MRKHFKWVLPVSIIAILAALGLLFYNGVIHFNSPSLREYPVQGVDVSAYQGAIDWDILSRQNIRFAYIKATEGSGMQDENFNANWQDATQTALKVGAYHFFSFESPGATQADNYIKTVPKLAGSLPPAIDLELYGAFNKKPPSRDDIDRELGGMLSKLEAYYGKKPVIYVTEECYSQYIQGGFTQNPIWIRSVYTKPSLPDGHRWTFWQYSARYALPGYQGEERFIDMNVYNGSAEQFKTLYEQPMKQ